MADWVRVDAALDVLLDLPPHQRTAALLTLTGDDAGLRAELESLLARIDGEDPVLDRPLFGAHEQGSEPTGSLASGTRIGAYRVLALIGRGGMGEVYRAERADGQYQQEVALKLIRREVADQPARFQVERQTLARLDHPGIARLLDGGVAEDGRPYMVMDLVTGRNIVGWCAEHAATLDERLRLFSDVCGALEYAHRNLVVHRDLKPANVLVTDEGTVKLLDFGIAKLLGVGGEEGLTQHAVMTPGYAAPEQLTGGAITTATDVYALGMLLFELLTGERPWRLQDLPLVDGIEKVLREAPPAPSKLASSSLHPPVAPKLLRGDLDAIVSKAVRKESDRRYETVAAMRSDIDRSRRHEPVTARDGAASYLLGRFLRRNRFWVASGGLILAAVIAGVVGVAWQARVATGQARRAELANQKATAVKDFLLAIFRQTSVQNPGGVAARNVTAEQMLGVGADRIRFELRSQPEIRSELLDTLALLYDELGISDRAAALAEENLRLVRARDGAASVAGVRAQTRLADALIDGNKDGDAKPHLRAALATLDAMRDRDSIDRAAVLVSLARVAYDGTAAEKQVGLSNLREALEIVQRREPANQLQGRILDYLGWYAQLDEDYPAAERWFTQLLTFEKAGGTERNAFAVGNAHLSLGDDQQLMGHYQDAEVNLRKAVELLTASAGHDHPTTAGAESRLGEALLRAGRRSEAEPLLIEALAAQKKSPQGIDDATETRKTLAALQYARGRLRSADELLRENLSHLQGLQDAELRYGVSASVLMTVLTAEGRLTEARSHYERASDIFRRYIGEQSVAYSGHLIRGAALEAASGRWETAEQLLLKILGAWPAPPVDLPELYIKAMLELSRLRLAQGRNESALAVATALVEKIRRSPDREHLLSSEAAALQLGGEARTRLGRAADAEGDLRRAVELRAGLDDAISPWLAEARVSLARCLMARHRTAEARSLLALASSAQAAQPALAEQYRAPLRQALHVLGEQ